MPWGGGIGDCGCCGGGDIYTPGSIPSCFCSPTPGLLQMTSADPTCNFSMFQNCFLEWQPRPAAFDPLGLPDNLYLSTESFPDPIAGGAEFIYYLACQYNQFTLSRLYAVSPYGSPFHDGILYTWLLGGINTCTPLVLSDGTAFPGSDASCCVAIFNPSAGPAPTCT